MPNAPILPDSAPFNLEQRAWLNGMLAALYPEHSSSSAIISNAIPAQAAPPVSALVPVSILFGTQTGNTESVAKKITKAAAKHNIAAKLTAIAEYDVNHLKNESQLMILTSTYGDGEPPDSVKEFYDFIHSADAPRLENVQYSVLGMGDSSYPDFNQCAIDIDKKLEELGARRFTPSVFCDVDYDSQVASWQSSSFQAIQLLKA